MPSGVVKRLSLPKSTTYSPPRGFRGESALAQAKSANYCGQFILMRRYGVAPESLYLAGGFANYINVENAVSIGFIAGFPPEQIVKVGNASLEGATIMRVSGAMRRLAETMVKRIEHVELEQTPDFFDIFVEGCHFKPLVAPHR